MRLIRIVLTLSTLLACVSPAAATPDSTSAARHQIEAGERSRVQADRVERQLRYAHHTRIDIEGHTYELINPRVGVQGIAYERIPGYPKTRPALVAGANWDSLAMPHNPIPWSRIDRIERGFPTGAHGARDGALIGLLVGVLTATVTLAATDDDPYSYAPLGAAAAVVFSPLLGAFVGGGFHTTRWEQVYPESKSNQR